MSGYGEGQRTTYHPAFYRVITPSVAGSLMTDFDTIERARAYAGTSSRVYACWYVEGQYALDMEVAR